MKRQLLTTCFLLLGGATCLPSLSPAETMTFQEVADSEMGYQTQVLRLRGTDAAPSEAIVGSSNLQVGRTPTAGDFLRGVLGFDISAIPAGSTINSVTLTLTHRRPDTGTSRNEDVEYQLHQLIGNFVETQAQWPERATGVPWTTPGGDFDPSTLSTIIDNPEGVGAYLKTFESTPAFVAAAQGALDGAQDLNMLIRSAFAEGLADGQRSLVNFVGDDQDALVLATDAPLLTIDYTAPPTTVPEPSTLAVIALGAAGALGIVAIRRGSRAS